MATKYIKYEVPSGESLVRSEKSEMYYSSGDEALYKIVDTHYLGYEWVKNWSYANESDNPYKKKITTTAGLRVKKGEEFFQSLKVTAEYKGLSVSGKAEAELSHKSFTEQETNSETKIEEEFEVKANTSVYLYQKIYHFRTDIWFKLDAWNNVYTVGRWERDGVAVCSAEVSIGANEFIQTKNELHGKGKLEPETVPNADTQSEVLRFEKCTSRCQKLLHSLGV
ncbi:hypothetical protein PG993_012466 [Apiospora rasikravindrae]|uniref:Uncharacterized protein n=1 Tax=Apiospora rasikravindrae TaxID=990691 RepID=A0ABR1S2P0_9PEZI